MARRALPSSGAAEGGMIARRETSWTSSEGAESGSGSGSAAGAGGASGAGRAGVRDLPRAMARVPALVLARGARRAEEGGARRAEEEPARAAPRARAPRLAREPARSWRRGAAAQAARPRRSGAARPSRTRAEAHDPCASSSPAPGSARPARPPRPRACAPPESTYPGADRGRRGPRALGRGSERKQRERTRQRGAVEPGQQVHSLHRRDSLVSRGRVRGSIRVQQPPIDRCHRPSQPRCRPPRRMSVIEQCNLARPFLPLAARGRCR